MNQQSEGAPRPGRRRRQLGALLAVLLLGLIAVAAPIVDLHLRAASLLQRFAGRGPPTGIATYALHAFDEEDASFELGGTKIPARLYRPREVRRPPGLVLLHGLHHLGISEPRLVRFSQLMAESGVAVFTPEIRELVDFRVEPQSIAVIASSVRALRLRLGPESQPVGLMGLSFAGGLALLAAVEPAAAPDVGYVVTVGAHDDLARVLRFLVTHEIPRPDGSILRMQAHEYGALVLLYAHVDQLFPPREVALAREVIHAGLREDSPGARERARKLSPESQALLEAVLNRQLDPIRDQLLALIEQSRATEDAVSPHGKLSALRVPVLILHGAGDDVIPPSEALWLARTLPDRVPRRVLITRAFQHVELRGEPTLREKLQLVRFIAALLALAAG